MELPLFHFYTSSSQVPTSQCAECMWQHPGLCKMLGSFRTKHPC